MPEYQYLHIISRLEDIAAELRGMPGAPVCAISNIEKAVFELTGADKQATCPHANIESGRDDFRYGFIEYARCTDCGLTLKHERIV